jgi:hypothetical protein
MKRKYYVNVQARTVNVARDTAVFEWEIEADAAQVEQLQERFEDLTEADEGPLGQFFQLGIGSDTQENEQWYEEVLQSIYEMIHRLATPESREQLEQSGVLMV